MRLLDRLAGIDAGPQQPGRPRAERGPQIQPVRLDDVGRDVEPPRRSGPGRQRGEIRFFERHDARHEIVRAEQRQPLREGAVVAGVERQPHRRPFPTRRGYRRSS